MVSLDNVPADLISSETQASPTMDPFEETIWEEIRRRSRLGDGLIGDENSLAGEDIKGDVHVSTVASNTVVADEAEFTPSYVSVSKHRVLQEPPSLGDFLTFIRKTLRIPQIKIIHDADSHQ